MSNSSTGTEEEEGGAIVEGGHMQLVGGVSMLTCAHEHMFLSDWTVA